jgi:DNA invertase Pin-like site-specific DNA recombinase
MLVALYERRSTNEILQADSLEAQDEILRRYAADHHHQVVDVFRDSASGRSVKGRGEFARLISLVTKSAPFEAVLVRDVSRWGRFPNIDESAYWEFFLLMHGIRVVYVQEHFRNDDRTPYDHLLKSLKRVLAAEFSRDKARMVQFGKYRAVKAGFWQGGVPPYGMRRVLVSPAGATLQPLRPGQRKALTDHHIKLARGPRSAVRVVRRIFHLFVKERQTVGEIVRFLNHEGIPSPKGTQWRERSVSKILTCPAYVGEAYGNFVASSNFAETQFIRVPDAWEAIVARRTWEAAQARICRSHWLSSPEGLAHQLRTLFEGHGVLTAARNFVVGGPCPDTFRKYFDGGDNEAIHTAYRSEIQTLWGELQEQLRAAFQVEAFGETVILNRMLRVGYVVAFPRSHHLGRVHWRFVFNGTETQDVTIGVALGPDATPAFYFRFVNRNFRSPRHTVTRHMYSAATKSAARSLEQIIHGLRRDALRYSSCSREQFLAAIANLPAVNTYAVARELGWPEEKGWSVYIRLRREGVALPPLLKQRARFVTLVCEGCGAERKKSLRTAMQWKSTYCRTCWNKTRAKYATCPDCGERRKLGRGALKRLKDGARSRCRPCSSRYTALRIWQLRKEAAILGKTNLAAGFVSKSSTG